MLDAVRASVDMLRGVAGFSVVRTEKPGSAIGPHGGIQEDMLSRTGFRGGLEARILSLREETLRRHGPSEEVPR
jgi:hypothetical protein